MLARVPYNQRRITERELVCSKVGSTSKLSLSYHSLTFRHVPIDNAIGSQGIDGQAKNRSMKGVRCDERLMDTRRQRQRRTPMPQSTSDTSTRRRHVHEEGGSRIESHVTDEETMARQPSPRAMQDPKGSNSASQKQGPHSHLRRLQMVLLCFVGTLFFVQACAVVVLMRMDTSAGTSASSSKADELAAASALVDASMHSHKERISQAIAQTPTTFVENAMVDVSENTPPPQNNEPPTAIPRVLILTYHRNLLSHSPRTPSNCTYQTKTDGEEECALAENVQHSIAVHPHAAVRFLTDDDCVSSLRNVYPALIPHFQNETKGMFKGDICRGSALYETGGIYLDVDLGVRYDLWTILHPRTEFVTARVHRQSKHPGNFFQAILGTTKHNPIILRYLDLFHRFYAHGDVVKANRSVANAHHNGHHHHGPAYVTHSDPLGVVFLRQALDDTVDAAKRASDQDSDADTGAEEDDDDEGSGTQGDGAGDVADHDTPQQQQQQQRRDDARTSNEVVAPATPKVELWQEVLYNPKIFPLLQRPPTWGTRRACHFVVVSRSHADVVVPPHANEMEDSRKLVPHDRDASRPPLEFFIPMRKVDAATNNGSGNSVPTIGFHVPLYSRIAGSRICPNDKGTWEAP